MGSGVLVGVLVGVFVEVGSGDEVSDGMSVFVAEMCVFVGDAVSSCTFDVVQAAAQMSSRMQGIVSLWFMIFSPFGKTLIYGLSLVACQSLYDGYKRFNLMRASAVVNCQSTILAF